MFLNPSTGQELLELNHGTMAKPLLLIQEFFHVLNYHNHSIVEKRMS